MLRFRAYALGAMALVLAATTLTAVEAVHAPPAGAAPVLTPSIDPYDRNSVLDAYEDSLVEARAVPVGWTGNAANCTKGTESSASIDATRAAVNFYRALNGLPPVTINTGGNAKALAAALIMQANSTLDHYPASTMKCWTQEGYDGASQSNLSQFAVAARAVDVYMEDPGSFNDFAGHRRWILYPPAATMGTGSTTNYNALNIPATVGSRPVGPGWIAWPNAGFVPKSVVKPLFSLSSNVHPNANYAGATITVKVGSTSLAVTKHPLQAGYGDHTLTWQVALPANFQASDADVRFDISVSGIKTAAGATLPTLDYSSTAIVNRTSGSAPAAPTNVTGTRGDGHVNLSWSAPTTDGGSPVTGYVVTPYVGGAAQPARTFASTATSQTLRGLTNGTAYTFRVAAVNANGTSALSAASAALTPATVPGAPTAPTATAGNGQVQVSWTAPTSNGGSSVTAYQITPYVGGEAQPPRTSFGAGTSQTITGLANGTAYTFKIAATNAVGTGSPSASTSPVTPVAPAVPYAPFPSWGAMVDRLFLDLTAVGPTPSQRSSWIAQLGNGSKTPGDLVVALRGSQDNTSKVDPGTRLYGAFMGRIPDAGGLEFWTARRRAGTWTLNRMADNFAGSSEFRTKYGTLSNRAFVTRIYTDVLGRAADPTGVDYWTRQLDLGRRTRGAVMVGFSESNEYRGKQIHEVDVSVAMIFLLDRAPTLPEVASWTASRQAGTSHAVLADQLLDSNEYAVHITG